MGHGREWTCKRCGGTWIQRSHVRKPRRCGKQGCQSPYWDLPITREAGQESQDPLGTDQPPEADEREDDSAPVLTAPRNHNVT